MKTTLVTCTRNRPEAFQRCAEMVARSTVLPDRWLIVSDGDDGMAPLDMTNRVLNEHKTCHIDFVRRWPQPNDPPHTLPLNLNVVYRNISAEDELLIFWEDDDWYAPTYIEHVKKTFEEDEWLLMYGQSRAKYYRLQAREWALLSNLHHASLCATAFRVTEKTLRVFALSLTINLDPFVDIRLWNIRELQGREKKLDNHLLCIGLKQMPGTPSTTMGWKGGDFFNKDVDHLTLKHWVGPDADWYIKLMEGLK